MKRRRKWRKRRVSLKCRSRCAAFSFYRINTKLLFSTLPGGEESGTSLRRHRLKQFAYSKTNIPTLSLSSASAPSIDRIAQQQQQQLVSAPDAYIAQAVIDIAHADPKNTHHLLAHTD